MWTHRAPLKAFFAKGLWLGVFERDRVSGREYEHPMQSTTKQVATFQGAKTKPMLDPRAALVPR